MGWASGTDVYRAFLGGLKERRVPPGRDHCHALLDALDGMDCDTLDELQDACPHVKSWLRKKSHTQPDARREAGS